MKIHHIAAGIILGSVATGAAAATCSASSSGVVFGAYTPNQNQPADSTGTITLRCTKGLLDVLPLTVQYTIDLNRGGSSSFSPRVMKSGSNALSYNLYRDLPHTSIWGDNTGGTAHLDGTLVLPLILGTSSGVHTLYGRIFASQNAVPGAYSDTIVVTISY